MNLIGQTWDQFQKKVDAKRAQVFGMAWGADYPDADVLILMYRAGFKAEEIPVAMRADLTGKSMHSGILRPMFYVFKMLLSICVTVLREPPDPDRIPK